MANTSTADIRQYLTSAYSDEELATLCSDYFRDVYDTFAAGMTKTGKIQLLLDHCQRREVMPNLLAALERDRPDQYQKRFQQAAAEPSPAPFSQGRNPRQVFISHAHEDADFAHRLAADLRARGWRVWIAPDSIRPGEKWAEAIDRGLEECGVFVVALTPAAVRSEWVRTETNAAIDLRNKSLLRFIPAEIATCLVPPLWSAYQFISFRGAYEAGLAVLLAELGRVGNVSPKTDPNREREQPTAMKRDAPALTRKGIGDKAAGHHLPRFAWAGLVGLLLVIGLAFGPSIIRVLVPSTSTAPPASPTVMLTAVQPASMPSQVLPTPTFTTLSPTPTSTLGIGSTRVSEKDGMVMVYVSAGKFLMGSTDRDTSAQSNEKPQHGVYLDAFWIDRTEVTNAMYARCIQHGVCRPPGEIFSFTHDSYFDNAQYADYPVLFVSWDDATRYCAWVGRRLPTEAEWEKATRGTDGQVYPWGDDAPDCSKLNYWGTPTGCVGDVVSAGSYSGSASPYGALHMAGNVFEWVADRYASSYYANSLLENPQGPEGGENRVIRGGSWESTPGEGYVRATYRFSITPVNRSRNVGFRCAREASS